jgi:hypothetical protein
MAYPCFFSDCSRIEFTINLTGVWSFDKTIATGTSPLTLFLQNNTSITQPSVFGYKFVNTSGDPNLLQVAEFSNNRSLA